MRFSSSKMHHIHNSLGLCHGPRSEAHSATLALPWPLSKKSPPALDLRTQHTHVDIYSMVPRLDRTWPKAKIVYCGSTLIHWTKLSEWTFKDMYWTRCRIYQSISLSGYLHVSLTLCSNWSFTAIYHRHTYVNQIGLSLKYIVNNATILDFINFFQYLEFICFNSINCFYSFYICIVTVTAVWQLL